MILPYGVTVKIKLNNVRKVLTGVLACKYSINIFQKYVFPQHDNNFLNGKK